MTGPRKEWFAGRKSSNTLSLSFTAPKIIRCTKDMKLSKICNKIVKYIIFLSVMRASWKQWGLITLALRIVPDAIFYFFFVWAGRKLFDEFIYECGQVRVDMGKS